jgi:hypothetical protein
MSCTYAKLRSGEWGIRSTSALDGTAVVTKKSGDEKEESVGNLVWQGDGIYIYAIAETSRGSAYDDGMTDKRYWHRGASGKRYQCDRPGCNCGGYDDM